MFTVGFILTLFNIILALVCIKGVKVQEITNLHEGLHYIPMACAICNHISIKYLEKTRFNLPIKLYIEVSILCMDDVDVSVVVLAGD